MKTKRLALYGLTILLASTLVGCSSSSDNSSSKKTSDDTTKTSKKTTKKTIKKTATNKDQLDLTKSDVEEFNQSLIDGLNEDKSYADSGDDGYSYAKYIDTLSYDSNRGLRISVTPDFVNLSESDKNTFAGKAVGLAEAQLIIIGKNEDGTDKIHSNVYQADTKLGSAKFSNNREFNWN
ncbi:hypothetical protein [Companilactobacillus hulinensis]|uniref:hypothetical protein n=1 Tax=Companilactobacillus hulinensis TaxID=2486007 RepID=UPI000F7B7A8C|nr:hypothetical protein [Companilactobacillus hulinensis]